MASVKQKISSIEDTIQYLKTRKQFKTREEMVTDDKMYILASHIFSLFGVGEISMETGTAERYFESLVCAEIEELPEIFKFIDQKESKKFQNNQESYTKRFGKKEGANRFKIALERQQLARDNHGGVSTIYISAIQNGLQDEDAKTRVQMWHAKGAITRKKLAEEGIEKDPLYEKKRSKYSKHYAGFNPTFTQQDQLDLIKRTLAKGRGEELNKEERRHFYLQRADSYTAPKFTRVGYSIEQKNFFDSLLKHLVIEESDVYRGGNANGEWWIRGEDNKFYFLDCYFKSLKIAIEYEGAGFHPKSPSEWPGRAGFLVEQQEEKWAKDRHKEQQIYYNGIKLFYVWSDDDHSSKIEEIVTYIKSLRT